jgi:uncharacterized protein YhfF
MNKADAFYERFLKENQSYKNVKYKTVFHFELTEKLADELLELVLKDIKKATASSHQSYIIENEALPEVGDLNIVTNFKGEPRCIIKTTNVLVIPYKSLTYDIVKREGEDDCLASWQDGHQRFFEAEGQIIGYEFNEDMLVVFEDFEVIYKESI